MIYWFGIPRDQTPVGQVTFSIINKNGTSTAYGGVGSGSGAPLPKFWQTADGIKPSVANYFRHGAAHGYPFYNTPTVHINNFGILLEVAMNMIVILISTEMVHHPQRVIMVTKTLLS